MKALRKESTQFKEVILPLTDYEMTIIESTLNRLALHHQLHCSFEPARSELMMQKKILIPHTLKGKMTKGNQVIFHFIIGAGTERSLTHKSRLLLSYPDRHEEEVKKMILEIYHVMKAEMPHEFISMEHLLDYLGEATRLRVMYLSDNLLITVGEAIDSLFESFSYRGKAEFHHDRFERPERHRVEVTEDVHRYIAMNSYKIYEKNGLVFAVGITKQNNGRHVEHSISVFARTQDIESIQNLFDYRFEKMLFEGGDIKGGKFTGDQKIIRLAEKVTLDDIVLESTTRQQIEKEIFHFFNMEEIYRRAGLPFKRGVVLHGPPGTGKTMLSKILVSTMKETVIWVKAGDVTNTKDIDRIFRLARLGRPCIIILEDVDLYAVDRETFHGNGYTLATLMSHLDGLEENDGVLVILTTNRLERVEKAIVERPGRIDARIYMGELCVNNIAQLLHRKLGSFERHFPSFESVLPENLTLTGAMAIELSTMILKNAINHQVEITKNMTTNSQIIIEKEHVDAALMELESRLSRKRVGFRE
ncbi:AAA family ATPase [Heliorestis convoluta]|uniref:ATP-binding protein n=1 Tax=Heliorestis convoluta TaxID=356322 RepID=A0A5Q2N0Z6_9FIRM|nr:AAA family ATPase [Heliorestis convoluta]QGG48011.1 ATP-binding protein [Heliorestis convoluta]